MGRPGLSGVLTLTTGIQAMVAFAALTPPVLAEAALPDLGMDPAFLGFYIGAVYLAAAVTSLVGGGWIARFGAMGLGLACLGLSALGLGILALAAAPGAGAGAVLLAAGAALVVGLGYGPVTPASSHLLSRVTPPHRRALVFSIKQTGVPLGGLMAGAVVPGLTLVLGWQGAALVVALACLWMAAVCLPWRARLDKAETQPVSPPPPLLSWKGPGRSLRLVAGDPALRALAVASFVYAAMQLSLSTFLVLHLTEAAGLGLVAAGGILSLAQGVGAIARILCGWVADRFRIARPLLVALGLGSALGALGTGAVSPHWSVAGVAAVVSLWGVCAIGWNGVFLAEVARRAPEGRAGEATGAALVFTFGGVVAGPPAFGLIAGLAGRMPAFAVFAGVCLMGALVLAVSGRRRVPAPPLADGASHRRSTARPGPEPGSPAGRQRPG